MGQTVCVLHIIFGKNSEEIMHQLLEYATRINARYVRLDFYVCGAVTDDFRESAERCGSRVYFGPRILSPYSKHILTAFFRQHTEYRIVHTHLEEQSAVALEAAQRVNIPVRICHAHGQRIPQDHCPCAPSVSSRIGNAATYLFADCVAVGERLFGISNLERVIILPPFVDCAALRWDARQRKTVRDHMNVSYRTLVVGCLDPMLSKSELEHTLGIVRRISKEFQDIHLLLAGALRKFSSALRRPERRGLRISYAEDESEVRNYLPAVDVCLFPGNLMRIPYSLMEAQAAGVPCVLSDRIPREAILSPMSCSLYCHRPAAQWAQCVLMSAAQPRSSEQAEWTGQYDIGRSASWLERLYWEEGKCGKARFAATDVEEQGNLG